MSLIVLSVDCTQPKKKISEVAGRSTETSKIEMQRAKKEKTNEQTKNCDRTSKKCRTISKDVAQCEYQKVKKEETEKKCLKK